MNISEHVIVKMTFGSYLYGTYGPDSDTDLKGVFLPDKRDILLGRIPHQYSFKRNKNEGEKNTKNDIDLEIFSLHEFIKLACEGQTVALDMLHAPKEMLIIPKVKGTNIPLMSGENIWDEIIKHKEKFYTKNLHSFIGYAQRQAAKYGVKGSRLNTASEFLRILDMRGSYDTLGDFWDSLKSMLENDEHVHFLGKDENGIEKIQVCGKQFHATAHVHYIIPIMKKFYDNYGERAKQAAENEGIDWKAISHAVRAAFEVKELLIDKTITFPLKEAEIIKKIKYGHMDYTTEAAPLLEDLISECKELVEKSDLPEKVDRKFWDDFIIEVIEEYVL